MIGIIRESAGPISDYNQKSQMDNIKKPRNVAAGNVEDNFNNEFVNIEDNINNDEDQNIDDNINNDEDGTRKIISMVVKVGPTNARTILKQKI